MRRVVRHVLTIISALSLLLCVAVVVLWVRSYSRDDMIGYVRRRWAVNVHSLNGRLLLAWTPSYEGPGAHPFPAGWVARSWPAVAPANDAFYVATYGHFAGFAYDPNHFQSQRNSDGRFLAWNTGYRVYLPYWAVLLPPAFGLVLVARRRVRRRRALRMGLCQSCGYDLRASPEQCPECGTPVEAKAQS